MILTGNTIVVTGGGTGIGRGLAEAFKARGNKLIVAGQSRFLERDAAATPGMTHLALDQDDPASVLQFAEALARAHPETNVLVNNAGIQRVEDLTKGEMAAAEETIATNLLGPLRVTAALISMLLRQSRATIINVTSALAFLPVAVVPTYSASKAAFHSYTVSLRYQLRATNVQVIEIVPPMTQTALQGDQGFNPAAMTLRDLISEVMALLEAEPQADEIVPDHAKALRFAERDGFEALFQQYNAASTRR